ncbi:transcriptional regulator [Kitasatospora sp. RB6PN24]|uniref:transcriptional regulator n=1 Tax=Kitasatospora humi TaxID=2893891 RepID=UPI001E520AB8|nr:transcriptional regulator [Kitasatospora humi]MCC9308978.1 transcriptional regulator [Kitasatospora humi]
MIEAHQDGRYFDPERIKRWETGERIPTKPDFDLIARSYGLPVEMVRDAVTLSRRARRLARLAPLIKQEEEEVDRRGFLSVAVAAGVASEPWGRLATALSGGRVDAEAVAQLERSTASMFSAEEHTPARLLAAQLSAHLDAITSVLPGAGAHQRALTIAAGEAAALAGWIHWDLGDFATARQYYSTASLAGKHAGHGAVNALTLGYASYGVDPAKAREMLSAAQEQVRGPGYATARAWLCAREAEEAAKQGDREGAIRALERATTAFDYADPDGEQAWMSFFRRARLGSMAVATYAMLEHPALGAAADETLTALGSDDTKVRVAILGDVATGYLTAGHVEQAVEIGRRALAATVETETTMGKVRLHALAEKLSEQNSVARSFGEEIRATLGAAS